MNIPVQTISSLSKVQLNLKAVPRSADPDGRPGKGVTLLFGVGPHGICPFEKMLFGKAAGERFTMEIGTGAEREIFGHLNGLLSSALGEKPPYQLQGEVLSIASAADHELVKAMAEYSGCGGGCGCGCGG